MVGFGAGVGVPTLVWATQSQGGIQIGTTAISTLVDETATAAMDIMVMETATTKLLPVLLVIVVIGLVIVLGGEAVETPMILRNQTGTLSGASIDVDNREH